jgi:hypothetical protein
MTYEYKGWTLYTRTVKLKGGEEIQVHFFSKITPKIGTPCDLPKDYTASMDIRTGLPYVKKK